MTRPAPLRLSPRRPTPTPCCAGWPATAGRTREGFALPEQAWDVTGNRLVLYGRVSRPRHRPSSPCWPRPAAPASSRSPTPRRHRPGPARRPGPPRPGPPDAGGDRPGPGRVRPTCSPNSGPCSTASPPATPSPPPRPPSSCRCAPPTGASPRPANPRRPHHPRGRPGLPAPTQQLRLDGGPIRRAPIRTLARDPSYAESVNKGPFLLSGGGGSGGTGPRAGSGR